MVRQGLLLKRENRFYGPPMKPIQKGLYEMFQPLRGFLRPSSDSIENSYPQKMEPHIFGRIPPMFSQTVGSLRRDKMSLTSINLIPFRKTCTVFIHKFILFYRNLRFNPRHSICIEYLKTACKSKLSKRVVRKATDLSPGITEMWQQGCQAIQHLLRARSTGVRTHQGGISFNFSSPRKLCLRKCRIRPCVV
jgi:hypothetical protein